MAKKRTTLQPLPTNTSKWKKAFKKRKSSLFKKASELSELCGVETCVVVSEGPHDPTPDTWPPREEATPILSRFKHVPEAVRAKKMLNSDGILLQQVQKMQLQLQKIERENRELESAAFLSEALSGRPAIAGELTMEKMVDLSAMVGKRLGEVKQRIGVLLSESAPHHHPTPAGLTIPGSFSPPAPPGMTADKWAPTGLLPDFSFGSASGMALIPEWCRQGEKLGALESTSADMAAPLPNLCTVGDEKDWRRGPTGDNASPTEVGAEVDDDMERFLEGLIKGCGDDGSEFWDSEIESFTLV